MSAQENTPAQTRMTISGLQHPGEIRIDRWGVPHIKAQSLPDMFFLQGFNAARDRLFQIDLWRKRGLGLLAGDFGPGYLAQDRASRLFLYRGDMDEEYAHYGPDAREICTAFAAGINAYIAAIEAGNAPMPQPFERFGTRPANWHADDVVRIRIHSLAGNALSEFARLRLMQIMGAQDGAAADQLRAPLLPDVPPEDWGPMTRVELPDDALEVYRLAICPVSFAPARLRATLAEAEDWATTRDGQVVRRIQQLSGSNNWAVAASHTATGRPLMASDPHRGFTAPSLRYLVHMQAPGLSLIGAGEPSSPGIMAGHNGHAAFSMTYFPADQEDLMVLELSGAGYRHNSEVTDFTEIHETIPVRGAEAQPVTLRFAGHAPVLWQDETHALALRTTFTESGTAPYMACLSSMRARSTQAFRTALKGWGAPSSNQVYADVGGDILWQAAGRVPQRRKGRGLVPAPGDGQADWTGFLDAADLPGLDNPAKGFVHSANEMNLPASWDHDARPVSHEWYRDGRAARVANVLSQAQTDVAASCALQTDTHNALALRLCACLPDITAGADAAMMQAWQDLQGWDGAMHADSGSALLYSIWTARHLYPALIGRLPEPVRPFIDEVEECAVVELFENTRPQLAGVLGLGASALRRDLLIRTLQSAIAGCRQDHGDNPQTWRWGSLHRARFSPPSGGASIGPLEVGGGIATVMMQAHLPPDFQPLVGASVRMVVDVGEWDASRWINAPGQSEDANSAHGADLAAVWAAGDYVPMLYSDAAVSAATDAVWSLIPAG